MEITGRTNIATVMSDIVGLNKSLVANIFRNLNMTLGCMIIILEYST